MIYQVYISISAVMIQEIGDFQPGSFVFIKALAHEAIQ